MGPSSSKPSTISEALDRTTSRRHARVMLLTGPSVAGKTTLARAIQRAYPTPIVICEADRMFPQLPEMSAESWSAIASRAIVALHNSIRSWADQGFDLIADGSLPYENRVMRQPAIDILGSQDLMVIGVVASAECIRARMGLPEDLVPTRGESQLHDIHDDIELDLRIDTTHTSPDECARQVLDAAAKRWPESSDDQAGH